MLAPADLHTPINQNDERRIAPRTNYNTDFAGLHTELLRQTKLALGKV